MKIDRHPFVATPNKGKCSSCGKRRSDPIHNWKKEERDPATQIAYDLYPSSARPVNPGTNLT